MLKLKRDGDGYYKGVIQSTMNGQPVTLKLDIWRDDDVSWIDRWRVLTIGEWRGETIWLTDTGDEGYPTLRELREQVESMSATGWRYISGLGWCCTDNEE